MKNTENGQPSGLGEQMMFNQNRQVCEDRELQKPE